MGRDKARLLIDETSLIQLLASRFAGAFGDVLVAAHYDQDVQVENAQIARDIYHGVGPLGGMHAGLSASPDDANFVLACDMPFADVQLAQYLMSLTGDYDAVVPSLNEGLEPLFAVYRKSCLPAIETVLLAGRFRFKDLLDRVSVNYVTQDDIRLHDPDLRGFINVNSPEDYEKALKLNEGKE